MREIHSKMGIEYPFPNLEEDFLPVMVAVDENNQVVMAVATMPVVEVFLFVDREYETPGIKLETFKNLHEITRLMLLRRGFVEVNAFIPPQLVNFGRRLKKFGWSMGNPAWRSFSRRVKNV